MYEIIFENVTNLYDVSLTHNKNASIFNVRQKKNIFRLICNFFMKNHI